LHLGYHYVRTGIAPGPACSPSRLRAHIVALKADGYEFLACREVSRRLRLGLPLPDKHATLSFDDGFADQYYTAFPILKEYGVPATFFYISCVLDGRTPPVIGLQILIDALGIVRLEKEIFPKVLVGTPYLDLLDERRYDASGRKMGDPQELRRVKWMFNHWPSQSFKRDILDEIFTTYIGEGSEERLCRERFMSEAHLREMHASGMEIGSHTVTHPAMNILGRAEIESELKDSRRRIERELGGTGIVSFAWPFGGRFRDVTRRLVGTYYETGWNYDSTLSHMPEAPYADLTDIPRMNENMFMRDAS